MEKTEPKYTQEFKEQMVAQYKSGTPARELEQRYGTATVHGRSSGRSAAGARRPLRWSRRSKASGSRSTG